MSRCVSARLLTVSYMRHDNAANSWGNRDRESAGKAVSVGGESEPAESYDKRSMLIFSL